MREFKHPVSYLVVTPKGKLSKLEKSFLGKSWKQVRSEAHAKLLKPDEEVYILARRGGRVNKERS